jgi:hypothetical protein
MTRQRAIHKGCWLLGSLLGSSNSTLKEIAEHLVFHYAAMSRAIKWVERAPKCMIV